MPVCLLTFKALEKFNISDINKAGLFNLFEWRIDQLFQISVKPEYLLDSSFQNFQKIFNDRRNYLLKYFACPQTMEIFSLDFLLSNLRNLTEQQLTDFIKELDDLHYNDLLIIVDNLQFFRNITNMLNVLGSIYCKAALTNNKIVILKVQSNNIFEIAARTGPYYTYFGGAGAIAYDRKHHEVHTLIRQKLPEVKR